MLCRLKVFDHLLAFLELDVGFLPIAPLALAAADAPPFPDHVLGADALDLDLEQLLHGLLISDLLARLATWKQTSRFLSLS